MRAPRVRSSVALLPMAGIVLAGACAACATTGGAARVGAAADQGSAAPAAATAPAPVVAPTQASEPASAAERAATPAPDLAPRVDALVRRLDVRAERSAARAELLALGEAAMPALLSHRKSPSFTVRWEVANVAGLLRAGAAAPELVDSVLRDVNPHIRWRSIWALGQLPRPSQERAVALLREALASGENDSVRWNAAVGLSNLDDRTALPALHAGVAAPEDWRRFEALNGLSRMHDATSASVIAPLITSGKLRDRQEAVLALGSMEGAEAEALLVTALGDANPAVRWRAAMSLGRMGSPQSVPALEALVLREANAEVLEHARRALAALRSGVR